MVWHNSRLNLTVDKHTEALHIPAEFSHRNLLEVGFTRRGIRQTRTQTVMFLWQLNVGAIQESQRPKRGFHGCLENLLYNNLNLIELAKRRAPQVSLMVSTGRTHFVHMQKAPAAALIMKTTANDAVVVVLKFWL